MMYVQWAKHLARLEHTRDPVSIGVRGLGGRTVVYVQAATSIVLDSLFLLVCARLRLPQPPLSHVQLHAIIACLPVVAPPSRPVVSSSPRTPRPHSLAIIAIIN